MTVRMKHLPAIYGYAEGVEDEGRRLDELSEMLLLDKLSEERIEHHTKMLADTLGVAVVITESASGKKTWSNIASGARFSDAERGLCLHAQAVGGNQVLILNEPDSDPRFADHPAVRGRTGVKFLACAMMLGPSGGILGSCYVIDYRQRELTLQQIQLLKQTVNMIEREMQHHEIVVELRERIRDHILRDPATDLPSLSLFHSNLDRRLRSKGPGNAQCLVAVIRLTRYDMLENALGRAGAAYLISEAVSRINSSVGGGILVGQIREDELVVAGSLKSPHSSYTDILDMIVGCFKESFPLGDETFLITIEIGASRAPSDAGNSAELVRKARIALRSKESTDTSGRYRMFSQSFATQSDCQFRLESALTRGLSQDEFYVVYQPIVSSRTGEITGAEALLRWNNLELGEVSPNVFIPLADHMGILNDLGDFVLSTVCRNLSRWQSSRSKPLKISVNISSSQLHDPVFADRLIHFITLHDVDSRMLGLEITESSLIEDPTRAIEIMNNLREKSISFSIDDFGTGFSSLNYLSMMPLSILKIDRSFVVNIPENRSDVAIARSIIDLAHNLGLTVIAEGVETSEQLDWLRKQKCDEIQGYIYSKPLRVTMFDKLTSSNPVFPDDGERSHSYSPGDT